MADDLGDPEHHDEALEVRPRQQADQGMRRSGRGRGVAS
jgi:hypothetical protein